VNKNTLISSTELKNNQVTQDRSDINDLSNPQNADTEEKYLSGIGANVEGVQTDEQEIRKREDWVSSEIKKTTQNHGLMSEEHVESQNGNHLFFLYHPKIKIKKNCHTVIIYSSSSCSQTIMN